MNLSHHTKDIAQTDLHYLHEGCRKVPKDSFKFILEKAGCFRRSGHCLKILDVGCASGEFLEYLTAEWPGSKLTGIDIIPELLEKARLRVPSATFIDGDILDARRLPSEKFDMVFMNGVNQLFDQFQNWIEHLLALSDVNGCIFVFGMFNPEDLDVLTRVRRPSANEVSEYNWNCFSRSSISKYLRKLGKKHLFHDWEIKADLARQPHDSFRSWTIKLDTGERLVVNGAQLIQRLSLLEIQVGFPPSS